MIKWHRIFGAVLCDFFDGSAYTVELEKDLSLKQQFLDVVILHKRPNPTSTAKPLQLPDGLDNLRDHNLLTFKSHQETLNRYALYELYGHFINYCKQLDNQQIRVDFDNCQLYAVCAMYPHKLFTQGEFKQLQAGVYECKVLEYSTRILVTREMSPHAHNAIWQLFSGNATQFASGAKHYGVHRMRRNELMRRIFRHYQLEELFPMAYTLEQFEKDLHEDMLNDLTEWEIMRAMQTLPVEKRLEGISEEKRLHGIPTEKRLEGIPTEKRLEGISTEERLEGIPTEERLEGIPTEKRLEGIPTEERLEGISAEQRLAGLSADEIKKILAELNKKYS